MTLRAVDVSAIMSKHEDPLEILKALDGYYECRHDAAGRRSGLLVGYAGKSKKTGLSLLGEVYANWAKAEEWPFLMAHFAMLLRPKMMHAFGLGVNVFCGAPLGGMSFGAILALHYNGRFVFPEKKVKQLASAGGREEAEMVFSRHEIHANEDVAVVEDVTNNFSTTNELLRLIRAAKARPRAILCLHNRSLEVDDRFTDYSGEELPVVALVRKPFGQFEQDDPAVAEDVARGNVVWKPKNEWPRLMASMNAV